VKESLDHSKTKEKFANKKRTSLVKTNKQISLIQVTTARVDLTGCLY